MTQSETRLKTAVGQYIRQTSTLNPISCAVCLPPVAHRYTQSTPIQSLSLLQFRPSMSDCLQPVAFTSHADGAIGPANSILILMGGEGHGRVTQLHTSQLGPLSAGSAPPRGNQGGQKAGQKRGGGEREENGVEGRQKVTGTENLSPKLCIKLLPVGLSDVVLTQRQLRSDMALLASAEGQTCSGWVKGSSRPADC